MIWHGSSSPHSVFSREWALFLTRYAPQSISDSAFICKITPYRFVSARAHTRIDQSWYVFYVLMIIYYFIVET